MKTPQATGGRFLFAAGLIAPKGRVIVACPRRTKGRQCMATMAVHPDEPMPHVCALGHMLTSAEREVLQLQADDGAHEDDGDRDPRYDNCPNGGDGTED